MLILVIIINLVISAVNFYLVWRLKKLCLNLMILGDVLNLLTANVHLIFSLGEDFLNLGISKTRNFRANYGKIQNKIQLLRKILILVNLINRFRVQPLLK